MKSVVLRNDDIQFKLVEREWEEYHGITAAFTTLNEEKNIVDFIKHIKPLVKYVVMIDGGSTDRTVELAEPYVDILNVIPFKGHFGEQKNNALKTVYTDWTLFLDPDERLSEGACKGLYDMINQDKYDCYKIPRKQFIDGEEDKNVYPDRQARLFRTYCRFIRPIHEEVVGWKNCKEVKDNIGIDILHYKEKDRHLRRNECYPIFGLHYMHEWGKPGEQTKDTIVKPFNLLGMIDRSKNV